MGIVSRFERTLQSAVGDTFARVFGGNVVASEIESALQQQAQSAVRTVDGRRLAPNDYTITLGESDYKQFAEEEQLAIKTFSKHLADFIAEQGWETEGPVSVRLVQRAALHTGQFRADGTVARPQGEGTPASYANYPPAGGSGVQASVPGWYGPGGHGGAEPQAPAQAQAPAQSYDPMAPTEQGWREDDRAGARTPESYDVHYGNSGAAGAAAEGAGSGAGAGAGAASGVTLVLEDGSGRTFRLGRGSNLLGRGQDAHFRLPDTGVSRQHVDISYDGQRAVLSDLGSTNGTTVNGGPVQDWQLADGDVIRMGHSEILVRFG